MARYTHPMADCFRYGAEIQQLIDKLKAANKAMYEAAAVPINKESLDAEIKKYNSAIRDIPNHIDQCISEDQIERLNEYITEWNNYVSSNATEVLSDTVATTLRARNAMYGVERELFP